MSGFFPRTRRARTASPAAVAAPRPPAGSEPGRAAAPGGFRERGRLRRRARYLSQAREYQLRDLGGLVLDLHRYGADSDDQERENHAELVASKVVDLEATLGELHALEAALGEPPTRVLREPGLGGTCHRCGALHGSDARFCSACGTGLDASVTASAGTPAPAGSPAHPATPEAP